MKALLILALVAQPTSCPDEPERLAASALIVCAHDEAARLEPSGEPATDIATVVVSLCQSEMGRVIVMLNRCRPVNFKNGDFDKGLRERALREVIEIRAKRRR